MIITIDILSLFIGMILGFVVICAFLYFDKRWDLGFSEGWKRGNEYQKLQNKGVTE